MFVYVKMSSDKPANITIGISTRTIGYIAVSVIYAVTSYYFYRRTNTLSSQIKELENKVLLLENSMKDQQSFFQNKITELTHIIMSQNNTIKQFRPPNVHPSMQPKPTIPPFIPHQQSKPVSITMPNIPMPNIPMPEIVLISDIIQSSPQKSSIVIEEEDNKEELDKELGPELQELEQEKKDEYKEDIKAKDF